MKIYSMTATFGKLSHQTLTLQPGLNIIEAPNEWGKSTWCAFLVAMLYGINTREQTKTGFLADKEHYSPWNGEPMSGRMDICWKGRDITIERRNKARGFFNEFKAYETGTGIPVAELTAANCGQLLLGVEQSVFTRAGFVRLKDMPVTQDESLRRRLNALVTTGDESGSSDALAQKLKEIKNRCRFNRTGLLPQAEVQRRELQLKLEELEQLKGSLAACEKRKAELNAYISQLENHKQALLYAQDQNFAGKLAMAKAQLEIAGERVENLESLCARMPNPKMLELKKLQIHQLKEKQEALQMEIQLQPPAPTQPDAAPQFRGADPKTAVGQAEADVKEYERLLSGRKFPSPIVWIGGLMVMAAGIAERILTGSLFCLIGGGLLTLLGIFLQWNRKNNNRQLEQQAGLIAKKYAPLEITRWVAEAQRFADSFDAYEAELSDYRNRLHQLQMRYKAILSQIETMTEGRSATHYEQELDGALSQQKAYADALRERSRLEEMVATLESTHKPVLPPEHPDSMTFDAAQTERLLSDAYAEQRQLHQRQGQLQGAMEALGDAGALESRLEAVDEQIAKLENIHSAVVLAQQTLEQAKLELQRRFAPRISRRAQTLFGKLTDGRYQRIMLGEDFGLSAAAEGEDTLHGTLWRSDGTADQLYLALRLAVAEELTPEAPLVLDDALVRFDDSRLKTALTILKEAGEQKQVILFTCQSRESILMEEI